MSRKKPNPVGQPPRLPTRVGAAGRKIRPKTKQELAEYLQTYLNLELPAEAVCDRQIVPLNMELKDGDIHSSPLDYAWYAFNADFTKPAPMNADAVVWANRGGGKTKLAAALTLLDCVFKPKCQVRILSGSGQQAGRMYDYFVEFVRAGFEDLTCGRITEKTCCFKNKSQVEVLKQSETSVRSHHVHKVRCDEAEMFSKKVFEAAKFTTISSFDIVGAFEVISTMNSSSGIMVDIVKQARKINTRVFKWCLWDVIEKCEGRFCKTCPLAVDCKGTAKNGQGYYKISDAISQQRRSSRRSWVYEMLCNSKYSGKSYSTVSVRRY